MSHIAWSEAERHALAATFREVGPDAPTLCAGWRSRDLLAHIELRERAPWVLALDARGKPRPGEEPRQSALALEAATPDGYAALVANFQEGAGPRPLRWLGDRANLVEYVVHHEDLRRAGEGTVVPRRLPPAMTAAVLGQLRTMARLMTRRSPTGVVLVDTTSGRRAVVHRAPEAVAISGAPVELALAVTGRLAQAQVELTGRPSSVAALQEVLGS